MSRFHRNGKTHDGTESILKANIYERGEIDYLGMYGYSKQGCRKIYVTVPSENEKYRKVRSALISEKSLARMHDAPASIDLEQIARGEGGIGPGEEENRLRDLELMDIIPKSENYDMIRQGIAIGFFSRKCGWKIKDNSPRKPLPVGPARASTCISRGTEFIHF